MEREEEIAILIKHLKEDVKFTAEKYPNLLESTIIKNGKLIEAYQNELKELNQ